MLPTASIAALRRNIQHDRGGSLRTTFGKQEAGMNIGEPRDNKKTYLSPTEAIRESNWSAKKKPAESAACRS
jgi:hypothetical protein